MSVTRWISGCVLATAMVGSAAASSSELSVQDTSLGARTSVGSSASRTVDSSADMSGLSRSGDPAPASSDSSNDSGGSVPTSGGSRQPPTHHSSVGWQSLLPGSIQ